MVLNFIDRLLFEQSCIVFPLLNYFLKISFNHLKCLLEWYFQNSTREVYSSSPQIWDCLSDTITHKSQLCSGWSRNQESHTGKIIISLSLASFLIFLNYFKLFSMNSMNSYTIIMSLFLLCKQVFQTLS